VTNTQQKRLTAIAQEARVALSEKFSAREKALRLSRETVQHSANAIRAVHRGELEEARGLLASAEAAIRRAEGAVADHPDVYYAGFVEDSQKEFAEANAILAFVAGLPLPGPAELGVGQAAYLNGLAEAVGELRRYVLDSLRRDDFSRCEELLESMDEVYTILVTMDFPDAITRGLRRTTDMVRGVLERTRGDLTAALRQRSLERRLAAWEEKGEQSRG
jgi:translin